ncbi:MAG: dihydroorotase [Planctomyces sp.]|nr:dihydroorotase [Planctomyces sp.]
MRTLIANATCVLPEGTRTASVLIENGTIAAIDPTDAGPVDETVDGTGYVLMPGVIDDQVHFRDPGLTHKEDLHTGSLACAKGGVTTFFEMPNTNPATVTAEELAKKYELASGKCVVNYGFYIGATPDNVSELQKVDQTPGIKIFIGSSTGNLLVDEQAALETIFAETSLPICAHCEDEQTVRANRERIAGGSKYEDHSLIRDVEAAVVATRRAIDLAKRHQHRFHVLHVSTAAEIPLLKDHGNVITAEACPHHLLFSTEDYAQLGSLVQMNPSVKSPDNNGPLWQALLDDTIQVIATDHAPHTREEKDQPYPKSPSGLPAVENSLALMLDRVNQGLCTIEQVVHWMCEAPARVWDVVNKGALKVGFDADLVLVDMRKQDTILNENQLTKCGWSPWHGVTLTGWPIKTWVGGQLVFSDGKVNADLRGTAARFDHSRGGYWNHTL